MSGIIGEVEMTDKIITPPRIEHKIQRECLKRIRKLISEKDLTNILLSIEESCIEGSACDSLIVSMYDAGITQGNL